ncbi:MAG: glycosyltransferase family 39 protein [Clostridia bacterium]|nr:glycosyltransferase family 39 protein [Clostridia bacterium]
MKDKKIIILLMVALVIFTTASVYKTFQNDTFFAIAVGDLVLDNGIDMMEHFTWHENMSYCYSHWLFDIIIALINRLWGFTGIYIFTIIMANITSLVLFRVLTKRRNNEIISFIITLITIYLGNSMFTGRAQIVSFVLFILEVYYIEQFLEKPKKRYIIGLLIIPIIIANVHAAVWPMYFIMYLPYIAEYILSQMTLEKKYTRKKKKALMKLEDKNVIQKEREKYENIIKKAEVFTNKKETKEPYKIIINENKNVRILIIVMIIAILTGFLTPIGDTPFTYMIKQMENKVVSNFVSEMRPIIPIHNAAFMALIIIYISILTFTDTKIRISDGFFILGFILMTLYSVRSEYYLLWICAIPLTRIINAFILKYGKDEIEGAERLLNKGKAKFILLTAICIWSIYMYSNINYKTEYVDQEIYPVNASKYILDNLEVNNIRLYNGYNYGSYLEMKGIPVFIDSRADIWCPEFNDTTVLEDEYNLVSGKENYMNIFKKYNITHALIKKDDIIDVYISKDDNYREIYQDDYFKLYEKNSF